MLCIVFIAEEREEREEGELLLLLLLHKSQVLSQYHLIGYYNV
jgi:hypothetical protein